MTRRRVLAAVVLGPLVVFAVLLLVSGLRDTPGAFLGGGAFASGEVVSGPEPDWSFLGDVDTIEMQLLDPSRSRVIWVADHDGKAYIVSGYMGGFLGRLWKHWPEQAEQDGRAVVRIDGKRYERTLVRITSGRDVIEGVSAELDRKYAFGGAESIESGDTWLFELAPR